jgi:hypothetical protein
MYPALSPAINLIPQSYGGDTFLSVLEMGKLRLMDIKDSL